MPILDSKSTEFISRSAEQTRRAGMQLGSILKTGDIICLAGDLGSGKTTFVQGLAAGWGSLDQVSSPTFVLINVYRKTAGPPDSRRYEQLFHLDAYRLSGPQEAIELDLEYYIENGPLVIEWADRIQQILPEYHLWISLKWVGGVISANQRDLLISAYGSRYLELLKEFRRRVYGVS